MTVKQIIKDMIVQFFIILGCITISMLIFYHNIGKETIEITDLYANLIFSVLGTFPSLILVVHTNVSEKIMNIRRCIHFVVLEILLIGIAAALKIVNSPASALLLFVEIAAIYAIVKLLDWQNDKRTSDEINRGLKRRRAKNDNLAD